MTICITEKEFEAIFAAENEIATLIEVADEEYIKDTIPIIEALNSVIDKYRRARAKATVFNDVRKVIRSCYLKRGEFINSTELNRLARKAMRNDETTRTNSASRRP